MLLKNRWFPMAKHFCLLKFLHISAFLVLAAEKCFQFDAFNVDSSTRLRMKAQRSAFESKKISVPV